MKIKQIIFGVIFSFGAVYSVWAENLSAEDLPGIVATKGESTAFVRDYKDKNIVVSGELYQIHKGHNGEYIYYIVSVKPKSSYNTLLAICPVTTEESHRYDNVRKGDAITMQGSVSKVGIWYSDRLATILHSCSIQK